jgi:hypothetical protein
MKITTWAGAMLAVTLFAVLSNATGTGRRGAHTGPVAGAAVPSRHHAARRPAARTFPRRRRVIREGLTCWRPNNTP